MTIASILLAWTLLVADIAGNIVTGASALGEFYTATCEAAGGTYRQSDRWDGQWECVL